MINLLPLQHEVMTHWEDQGIEYFNMETHFAGRGEGDPSITESTIKPEYEEILTDPMKMIAELGFDKMSQYVASKQERSC